MKRLNEKVLRVLEYYKIVEKLVHHSVSPMAKEELEDLSPYEDLDTILLKQKETSEALRMILKKGSLPLGGLKDIRSALKRAAVGGILSIEEILHIGDVLRVTKKIKSYRKDDRKQELYPTIDELFYSLQTLPKIENEIQRCILNEEEIADDASTALSRVRRELKQSHDSVKGQLHNIIHSSKYSSMLQESVITMRGNRYCVPVKQEYRNSFPGMIHDQSATGSTLFIEPMAVVQLNNKIKELEGDEHKEIQRILASLTALAAEFLPILEMNLKLLVEMDIIFARAELSLSMNGTEPIFNEKGVIHIRKGRHPLLDGKEVVPIDIWLGDEFTSLVITGPNTGGKTVTLKTIGLFTLMGQSGLHIPAQDRSELAVFHEVFADIGDEQSIEQSLSTFSSHMTNIIEILKHVTLDSLVLFDELGAGTDPTEGAALAMAILESLHAKKIRTVATTHYSELKVYALSTEGVENASCEFNVETLRPTYKLLIGIPGKSNAFAISKRLGLSDDIIQEAKALLEQEDIRFEDLITDLEIHKKTVELEKEKAEKLRKEAQQIKSVVEDKREKVEGQREKILKEAREEARKILQQAKDEADETVKKINRILRENQKGIDQKEIEESRSKLRERLGNVETELAKGVLQNKQTGDAPQTVKLGQQVFVATFNQTGTVLTEPDSKGEIMVQMGIMKMKVNIKNISIIQDQSTKKKSERRRTGSGKVKTDKSMNASTELDVRGKTVEEALGEIDKYLDDAYLANLKQVTIIHGKGTGALRAAIQKYLRRNQHVESYRLGKYGEGESGVTVIELKQ